MERKTFLCAFAVLLWLIAFAASPFAGEVFMNDTGEVAKSFRIVFSEPVEITGFGDVFVNQDPSGQAMEFLFSGGEAQAWDSFWISWEPAVATVVETEWVPAEPSDSASVRIYSNLVTDDFNDGIFDPQIWVPIDISDPSVHVVEENGYLHIYGRRSPVGDRQTGLDTKLTFPSEGGFEVSLNMQARQKRPGFILEIHSTQIYYHITLAYGVGDYGFWWCYFGTEVPRGCREIGGTRAFGNEHRQYHQLRIHYDGQTREVRGYVDQRLVGQGILPAPLGPVIVRIFAQSGPGSGGRIDYRVDDFRLRWDRIQP